MRVGAGGRTLAAEAGMGMAEARARALWDDHYGPLAGWAWAVLGDAVAARRIADEAFLHLFAEGYRSGPPRLRLYRQALRMLEEAGRAPSRAPAGPGPARAEAPPDSTWLGQQVAGLPPMTRRCVLLAHAGHTETEIARVLREPRASTVRRVLALAATRPVRPTPPAEQPAVSRELTPSLRKTLRRWNSTVLVLRNSSAAICRLLSPRLTRPATVSSCGVSRRVGTTVAR